MEFLFIFTDFILSTVFTRLKHLLYFTLYFISLFANFFVSSLLYKQIPYIPTNTCENMHGEYITRLITISIILLCLFTKTLFNICSYIVKYFFFWVSFNRLRLWMNIWVIIRGMNERSIRRRLLCAGSLQKVLKNQKIDAFLIVN